MINESNARRRDLGKESELTERRSKDFAGGEIEVCEKRGKIGQKLIVRGFQMFGRKSNTIPNVDVEVY